MKAGCLVTVSGPYGAMYYDVETVEIEMAPLRGTIPIGETLLLLESPRPDGFVKCLWVQRNERVLVRVGVTESLSED